MTTHHDESPENGIQAVDPVCGMRVSAEGEHRHVHEEIEYLFCSASCREKFIAAPEQYLEFSDVDGSSYGGGHDTAAAPMDASLYTCPMHPEIQQVGPGACPKCGMALEPRMVEMEADNSELDDMSRRFWVSTILAIPVFFSAMAAEFWPEVVAAIIKPHNRQWFELILATPVVWWGGWTFFVRCWQSLVTRNLNMFTLIGIGVGIAWVYSVIGTVFPGVFPASVQNDMGVIPVYFEAAAVITALVLLGQVLELRARSQTNAAIKLLLGLAPKTARIVRDNGKHLETAARRLVDGLGRIRAEDRVIDFSIGLEALLSDRNPELSYRTSMRGAYVMAWEGGEISEPFEELRSLYDTRSRIVHGEKVARINLRNSSKFGERALRQIWWRFLYQGDVTKKSIQGKIDGRIESRSFPAEE
ncbi:MAG: YHS domain-containing protein [Proteobacteria bacterium]|nr:YHS domain-containing protein [Pseudomonadota bacterium]